jgi:hypothetical protein
MAAHLPLITGRPGTRLGSLRMPTPVAAPAALFLLVAFGAGPGAVSAQGIDGVVTFASTGEPAPGVLVAIYDERGGRVRAELTDATGRFAIDVQPGRYGLRADRIGLSPTTVEEITVGAFERVSRTVEMVVRPIELEGIVVDTRVRSCRTNSRQAHRVQRWWSEVRTALGVNSALQEEQFGHFLVERFQRVWDADLKEPIATGRRWEVSTSTRPFVSAPADELMERGFVTGRFGLDREYFGPDADVLLSTVFLSAHCFSLDEDRDRRGQIGLRFDPVDDRRVVDIAGTFWVDTTTATLTELDFEYVNLDGPDADDASGRAVFAYLPSGAWIVSDWYIRIPRTGMRGRRNRLATIGYFDGGGSVTPLNTGAEPQTTGSIRGVVRDEVRGEALEGATVTVLGTEQATVSDDAGRFEITGVPTGERFVSFEHPEVTRWGVDAPPVQVDVSPAAPAEVALRTPAFEEAAFALCLDAGLGARTIIVGAVVNRDGVPLMGVPIRLSYEVRSGPGGSVSRVNLSTDESGRFAVCSVPGPQRVTLSTRVDGEWRDITELDAIEGRITFHETRLGG